MASVNASAAPHDPHPAVQCKPALLLAAELLPGHDAPFHIPHLHDPVTLGSGCEGPATVGPPARTPDHELGNTNRSVFVKPDMADDLAGTPTRHVRPECDAGADGERLRPSDELSIDDIGPHPGSRHR